MSGESYKIVTLNGREEAFVDSVRETGQEAMHDDAIARWLVRDSLYRRFWSIMNDQYIVPAESNLNIALDGSESVILARIYPDEEKVGMEHSAAKLELFMHAAHAAHDGNGAGVFFSWSVAASPDDALLLADKARGSYDSW